jgi:hypothetical protein
MRPMTDLDAVHDAILNTADAANASISVGGTHSVTSSTRRVNAVARTVKTFIDELPDDMMVCEISDAIARLAEKYGIGDNE